MPLRPICLILLSAGFVWAAGAPIPERPSSDRYAKLRTSLPFAVATAAEKPPEEKVSWAQNLYLGPVAKPAVAGVEKDWVIIKDRTQPGVLIELYGNEPKDGLELVKLEWSDDPRKTKATVKKAGEFATLEPDQAAFTSTAPPASVQAPRPATGPGAIPLPGGGNPNAARPPAGAVARPPNTIPRPTNTAPIVQPAIRQPAVPPGAPQMQPQPLPQGASPQTRPRVRVINSQPTQ